MEIVLKCLMHCWYAMMVGLFCHLSHLLLIQSGLAMGEEHLEMLTYTGK